MNISRFRRIYLILTICFIFFASSISMAADGDQKALQQRIDFGNAQILGQSIKSGAVYLMHRKKSDIKNMIEVRENYRNEIREDFDLESSAIANGDDGLPDETILSKNK